MSALRSVCGPSLAFALVVATSAGTPSTLTMEDVPAPSAAAAPDTLPSSTFAVRGVRVFDGEEMSGGVTVLVLEDRVEAVGPEVPVPAGTPTVDGRGRTLLPGLVDAHVHTFDPGSLVQALAFGVTLQLDMFTQPGILAGWRLEQAEGRASARADILGAGFLATAEGGHGTQFGLPVPTPSSPADAQAWVKDRHAEGADFVKIVLEDGSTHGRTLPSLDDATLRALVQAAHDHGLLALVHVSTLADAARALDAGADGLVHLWVDALPEPGLAERMAGTGMFVVPTLTVLEGVAGRSGGPALLDEEGFAELLDPRARESLTATFPGSPGASWEVVGESLLALHAAGVPVLTGSDAPNPGTTYGASVHRELELMVEIGLSELDALRAATSAPARALGLEDRGRITPGARADLVLVEGDPSKEIRATRRIVGVWKEGRAFAARELEARVAAAVDAAAAPPVQPTLVDGEIPVSDFEDGTLSSALGTGWSETTDAMAGGSSTARLDVVEGGAEGSSRSLMVVGEVAEGHPFPWAGAMYFPGSRPMEPVDLSPTSGLAFHVMGSGPAFQVLVFGRGGQVPAVLPLQVGEGWEEVFLPWEAFQGIDPSGITGVAITAGPAPGPFEFQLDRVVFR